MDTVSEEWRDCPSVPGYQVSSLGRVRGKPRIIKNRGRMHMKPGAFCAIQTEPEKEYKFVRINPQGKFALKDEDGKAKTKRYYIHRLVAEAFIGPVPFEDAEVDHIDRDRQNNTPTNLRYVSRLENAQNRVLDIRYGARCNFAKLTQEQVDTIRESKVSVKEQAVAFGVSESTIRKILKGESWKK